MQFLPLAIKTVSAIATSVVSATSMVVSTAACVVDSTVCKLSSAYESSPARSIIRSADRAQMDTVTATAVAVGVPTAAMYYSGIAYITGSPMFAYYILPSFEATAAIVAAPLVRRGVYNAFGFN